MIALYIVIGLLALWAVPYTLYRWVIPKLVAEIILLLARAAEEEQPKEKPYIQLEERTPHVNQKLVKLLSLTQSPNDNEALVAVRKANELLRLENKTWAEMFSNQPKKRDGDPLFNALFDMQEFCINNLGPCEAKTDILNVRETMKKEGNVNMDQIVTTHKLYMRVWEMVKN